MAASLADQPLVEAGGDGGVEGHDHRSGHGQHGGGGLGVGAEVVLHGPQLAPVLDGAEGPPMIVSSGGRTPAAVMAATLVSGPMARRASAPDAATASTTAPGPRRRRALRCRQLRRARAGRPGGARRNRPGFAGADRDGAEVDAGGGQQADGHGRPALGVGTDGRQADQLDRRVGHGGQQRDGVVDVGADVGVDPQTHRATLGLVRTPTGRAACRIPGGYYRRDYLSPLPRRFSGAASALSFRFLARTAERDFPPAAARLDLGHDVMPTSLGWSAAERGAGPPLHLE